MTSRELHRVNNEPHLRKDVASGAVVNVSTDDYYKYLKKKEKIREDNARLDRVETELTEVKDILRSIADKLG